MPAYCLHMATCPWDPWARRRARAVSFAPLPPKKEIEGQSCTRLQTIASLTHEDPTHLPRVSLREADCSAKASLIGEVKKAAMAKVNLGSWYV